MFSTPRIPALLSLTVSLPVQDQDAAGIPLHLQGQNVGLSADDPNITLQIDPLLLQQTLQDSQNVSQQPQL